jgi:hypothetical protein
MQIGLEKELWSNEILPCHPRRNKRGEAHADGRGEALQQNTRHHCFGEAGLGDPWRPRTIRPRSRVVVRGDTESRDSSPFPRPSFLASAIASAELRGTGESMPRPYWPRPPATLAPPRSRVRRGDSRPSTFLARPLGWWSGSRLPIPRSSLHLSALAHIYRSFPNTSAVRGWPACISNASGNCSSYSP